MMVTYLVVDPGKTQHEIYDTRGCHVRFSFLMDLYEHHLTAFVDVYGDNARVSYHKTCALRSYLLVLANTFIFVGKSATYVNIMYLRYLIDLDKIHEYNYGISCLVYLYSILA